jgi:hypothetical protein
MVIGVKMDQSVPGKEKAGPSLRQAGLERCAAHVTGLPSSMPLPCSLGETAFDRDAVLCLRRWCGAAGPAYGRRVLLRRTRRRVCGLGGQGTRVPRRWYDKRSSVPEKLLGGVLRRDYTASGISRQMADFNATVPHPDGNQDAQCRLEIVLDKLKLFRVAAHDAFLGDETSNDASLDRVHESRAKLVPTAGRRDGVGA